MLSATKKCSTSDPDASYEQSGNPSLPEKIAVKPVCMCAYYIPMQ